MWRKLSRALLPLFVFVSCAIAQNTATSSTQAVQIRILHNFTGGRDGCCIYGGLARDTAGSLYGVAYLNGNNAGGGDLFELSRVGPLYLFHVLHSFSVSNGECFATPTLDAAGNLFGVCAGYLYSGTLWEYSKEGTFSVLHTFNGLIDGAEPKGAVVVDQSGNVYGTTYTGGTGSSGTLWEYSPSSAAFTVLHSFANGTDGGLLPAGPAIDHTGKIWGTTASGPNCYYCGSGTVWNYDPASETFTTLFDLVSYGIQAVQSSLRVDAADNLFGTGFGPVRNNCGLVYALPKSSGYAPEVLYQFKATNGDGCLPYGNVTLDAADNIFGATYSGGSFGDGAVYQLAFADGKWSETILFSFNISDGLRAQSGLITDGRSHWYGTTAEGGNYGQGTVFELSGFR